jgi:hypothetical protein
MSSQTAPSTGLQDFKINIRIKLSALWVVVMLLYIYGDVFSMFIPSRLKGLLEGDSGAGATTSTTLLAYTLVVLIPIIMVLGSLFLRPKITRVISITVGVIYTLIQLLTVTLLTPLVPMWYFYILLGGLESVATILIVWQAWRWPKQNAAEH